MVYEADVVFKVLVEVEGDEDEATELIKTRFFYQSGIRDNVGRYRIKAYPAHVESKDIKRATAAIKDEKQAESSPEPEEREDSPRPSEGGVIKLGRTDTSFDLF